MIVLAESQGIQGVFSAPLTTAPSLYTSQTSARRSSYRYCLFTAFMLVFIGFVVFIGNFLSVFLSPPGPGEFSRFVPFIVAFGLFFAGALVGIFTHILYRNNRYS